MVPTAPQETDAKMETEMETEIEIETKNKGRKPTINKLCQMLAVVKFDILCLSVGWV